MPKTLAEKVYDAHVVRSAAGEPVKSSTSQAWVVRNSQPPHCAIAALMKYVRKLGTDRADRGTRGAPERLIACPLPPL